MTIEIIKTLSQEEIVRMAVAGDQLRRDVEGMEINDLPKGWGDNELQQTLARFGEVVSNIWRTQRDAALAKYRTAVEETNNE